MTLNEIFRIDVTPDRLGAKILLRDPDVEDLDEVRLTKEVLLEYVKQQRIQYGIRYDSIETIVKTFPQTPFPLDIAVGHDKVDGKDGEITYLFDGTTDVDHSANNEEDFDFRNVMRIPTVSKEEKLATIIAPTKGKDGTTVHGTPVKARPGRPAILRPGKNVTFNEETQSFYANVQGQVSLMSQRIHVLDIYEVNESISMKIGNIDFPGSVIIRGDVPTGFTIKAAGDVKIFGLVEAATIIAEGTVTVSEGISGLRTGRIEAGEDVQIGYINQGIIRAGNDILIENSIMHSECTANNNINCNRGHIVGGVISAGGAIKANNIGNRMNTKTSLSFGMDFKMFERQQELEDELTDLKDNHTKLTTLKGTYDQKDKSKLDSKMRITLLRLQYSLEKTIEDMDKVQDELSSINATLGDVNRAYLKVKGTIYPNVTIQFGRYERTIDKEYIDVTIVTDKNEISIRN